MDPNSAASEQFRNAVDAAVDGYLLRHPSPAAIVCGLDAWKLLRKPSIWRGCFVVPDPIMPDAIATVRDQSFSDVSEANERASHEVLAHVNEITEMLFGPQAHAVGEEPRAAQGIGIFARALDVQRTLQEINMALVALAERIKSGA